jgi:murein L,D-transpeptidase YafK
VAVAFTHLWRGGGIRRSVSLFLAIVLMLLAAMPAKAGGGHWPTPENPVDFVRVLKSKRVLELWRDGEMVRSFRISLGDNPVGHKENEGDGRTPEGRYRLDWRKADSVAYRAFHISYPDREDRGRARKAGLSPGGSIMIHGQWNGYGWLGWLLQNYDWTNGCIGVTNAAMDEMWEMIAWNTPIEILP